MAGSRPEIRARICINLACMDEGMVSGENLRDIRRQLGMDDVSATQFSKAARALTYNPEHGKPVVYRRSSWGSPATLRLV